MKRNDLSKISKEELATEIGAFLNKHGNDREFLIIEGYEFTVTAMYQIEINPPSIYILNNGIVQFNGTAQITRKDDASGVITSNIPVFFHGVAHYYEDKDGDMILLKVLIDSLKNITIHK